MIVIDASDPNAPEQAKTVKKVLEEIGANEKESLVVLNKIDAVEAAAQQSAAGMPGLESRALEALRSDFPDAIETSAVTKKGLDLLKEKISAIIRR